MKLNPNEIQSDKIVLGVKFNNEEINGWNEFIDKMKNITTYKKKNNRKN